MELPFDPSEVRLMVGLEIHQQLSSKEKLFCSCPIAKSEELPYSFRRRLRPAQSETGRIDPAVAFEFSRERENVYLWSPESSCLVEADEEPPHPMNDECVETVLVVAQMLHSNIVDEVHVMRKIVIDGSNTGGFQRTSVLGLGGYLECEGRQVGVQTVTLEEDASRILGEDESSRYFALDRLGVPLVEIALEPVTGEPASVERIALQLGRALRATGRVARGLGTIRQDLNVSVMGGRVVEVKGVQNLALLQKVVVYEAARQVSLVMLGTELAKRGVTRAECRVADVSALLRGSSSRVMKKQTRDGGKVVCIVAKGFSGLLGLEPFPGIRLGRELAEVARASGLGGIIHSDEFRRQDIGDAEEASLRDKTGSAPGDALVLVAGNPSRVDATVPVLIQRLEQSIGGVPAETRAATADGETKYLRPRPGAQRMYPETDIPEILIKDARRKRARALVPVPWEEQVKDLEKRYSISEDLALKLYDGGLTTRFEQLALELKTTPPSVVASGLTELTARVAREFEADHALVEAQAVEVLRAIDRGEVAKEAEYELLAAIVGGEAPDVRHAISSLRLTPMGEEELAGIIDRVIADGGSLISEKGGDSFSALMGGVMKRARGRADGQTVGDLLRRKLDEALRKKGDDSKGD